MRFKVISDSIVTSRVFTIFNLIENEKKLSQIIEAINTTYGLNIEEVISKVIMIIRKRNDSNVRTKLGGGVIITALSFFAFSCGGDQISIIL